MLRPEDIPNLLQTITSLSERSERVSDKNEKLLNRIESLLESNAVSASRAEAAEAALAAARREVAELKGTIEALRGLGSSEVIPSAPAQPPNPVKTALIAAETLPATPTRLPDKAPVFIPTPRTDLHSKLCLAQAEAESAKQAAHIAATDAAMARAALSALGSIAVSTVPIPGLVSGPKPFIPSPPRPKPPAPVPTPSEHGSVVTSLLRGSTTRQALVFEWRDPPTPPTPITPPLPLPHIAHARGSGDVVSIPDDETDRYLALLEDGAFDFGGDIP